MQNVSIEKTGAEKVKILIIVLTIFAGAVYAASGLPNPSLTPGATDPRVTQENIHQTICQSGYTKTVRPTVSYTNKLKLQQMREYGYADADPRHFEEDHFIPLEIGGHPTDPHNLWPQPWTGEHNAHDKDKVENAMHRAVCVGKMTLKDAQEAIRKDWVGYGAHR